MSEEDLTRIAAKLREILSRYCNSKSKICLRKALVHYLTSDLLKNTSGFISSRLNAGGASEDTQVDRISDVDVMLFLTRADWICEPVSGEAAFCTLRLSNKMECPAELTEVVDEQGFLSSTKVVSSLTSKVDKWVRNNWLATRNPCLTIKRTTSAGPAVSLEVTMTQDYVDKEDLAFQLHQQIQNFGATLRQVNGQIPHAYDGGWFGKICEALEQLKDLPAAGISNTLSRYSEIMLQHLAGLSIFIPKDDSVEFDSMRLPRSTDSNGTHTFSVDLVASISSEDNTDRSKSECNFVAKCPKDREDHGNWWRRSFSQREMQYLHRMDEDGSRTHHSLLRVFKCLRFCDTQLRMFSNYIFKNVLLHVADKTPISQWSEEHLAARFMDMLRFFIDALKKKNLSQFFNPEHNLLKEKTAENLDSVLHYLERKLTKQNGILELLSQIKSPSVDVNYVDETDAFPEDNYNNLVLEDADNDVFTLGEDSLVKGCCIQFQKKFVESNFD